MFGAVNGTHLALLADLHRRTCYVPLAYVCILRSLKPVEEIGPQCLVKIHLQAGHDRREHHLRVTEAGGERGSTHGQECVDIQGNDERSYFGGGEPRICCLNSSSISATVGLLGSVTNWKGGRTEALPLSAVPWKRANERTWLFFVTASQSSTRSTFSVSGTTSRISGLRVPSSSSRPLFVPRPPSLRRPPPGCAPRAAFDVLEAEALAAVVAACARERSF